MKKFILIMLLAMLAACGIKRDLSLPCQQKYHKNAPDDGSAPAPTPTPADTTPCVNTQVVPGGQLLTPATQPAPTPTPPASQR